MTHDGIARESRTRRDYLASAGAVVAGGLLAGCSSQSEAGTPTDETTPTATADGTAQGPTVQVRTHPDLGDILVGPGALTLYMYDPDTQGAGASTCDDSCAEAWPPLTADDGANSGDGVTAELTTFERDTGAAQVAANGWPLYYWASDSDPGDATGQGVNDVWWVLRPDGTTVRSDGPSTA